MKNDETDSAYAREAQVAILVILALAAMTITGAVSWIRGFVKLIEFLVNAI